MPKIFLAFPSQPATLIESYKDAVTCVRANTSTLSIVPWTELKISGQFIWQSVISSIQDCDVFCADITLLNLNVVYEIGYAIALKKPIVLLIDQTMPDQDSLRLRLGLFDTIGFDRYTNSATLAVRLAAISTSAPPVYVPDNMDYRAPVYLLDSLQKDGLAAGVFSSVVKDIGHFRSFDPLEQARLPMQLAIREVAVSVGIIVPFLPANASEAEVHNLRASFLAGLARGLNKESLLLQLGDRPTPLDFRDDTIPCTSEVHVKRAVDDFALRILPLVQQISSNEKVSGHTFLEQLQIGASVAENELHQLPEYFLRTDAYQRAERGEARVVVGRKGSGKTAIFACLRDEKRRKRNDIIVDLKPEGYKLLKFRDDVLSLLQPGTLDHVVTALWDYVLLLEIAYKLLDVDRLTHHNNHKIYPLYNKLKYLYFQEDYHSEGDFSERLSALLEGIGQRLGRLPDTASSGRLSNPQVAEILYRHPIPELRACLVDYLHLKGDVWILVDNVDKGWPSNGLTAGDISLVRCLIEGVEKLRRQLARDGKISCTPIVFLRNDVFEHLIERSSDRGKISSVAVDWTDRSLLEEMLRLRLVRGGVKEELSFEEAWSRIATPMVGSVKSIDFVLRRSLMRPRALLDLVLACRGFAVNRRHKIIEQDDIIDGYKNFSLDLVENVSLEIRDVAPDVENALYMFIDKPPTMRLTDLRKTMKEARIKDDRRDALLDLFLWYGVLGVEIGGNEIRYIYDVNYNFRMLKTIAERQGLAARFTLNPAFRQALAVSDPTQAVQPRFL